MTSPSILAEPPDTRPWFDPGVLYLMGKGMALGLFLWCGLLAIVIEEFFKPSYALWMVGGSIVFLAFALWQAHRGRTHSSSEQTASPSSGYHSLFRAMLTILALWWLMEFGAFIQIYHYAWPFTFRAAIFVVALPVALILSFRSVLDCGLAVKTPLVVRHGPQSLLLGALAFHVLTLFKSIPAAQHFLLPKVVAGLVAINAALVVISARSATPADSPQSIPFASGRDASLFWGFGLGIGHLLPVVAVGRGLTGLETPALLCGLFGISICERVLVESMRRDAFESGAKDRPVNDRGREFP